MLLRNDLAGATSPGLVWQKGEAGIGYWRSSMVQVFDSNNGADSLVGDFDDGFALTTRSNNSPLSAKRLVGNTITSPLAEVVWFLTRRPQYSNLC